jgi:hypothetical protein
MEGEIRAIRDRIRNGSSSDDHQLSEERDLVIVEDVEGDKDVPSDSPVSEIERRILRRTRLMPRKLPPVEANLEHEVSVVVLDGEDEPPNEGEQTPSSSSQA